MSRSPAPAKVPAADDYGSSGRPPWADTNWSAQQRWVTVEDRPVSVVEVGSGPPVVLIHGHSGTWTNWLENILALAEDHRVIAFDLPGFGDSPMPREPVTMTAYARIVEDLLEQLDAGPVAVVGNSMGGFVGAELAIRTPARVERLVLAAAAGVSNRYFGLPNGTMERRLIGTGFKHLGRLSAMPIHRIERAARRAGARRLTLGMVVAHPDRLSPFITYHMLQGAGKDAAHPAAIDIGRYDFRDRLPEIACPTLVVWGDRDRVVPVWCAGEFERLIPDARKVIFADTGHVPMLERPARFNALLEAFLAEEPGEQVDAEDALSA